MERMEIREKYFYELGRCKHYEMKCCKYENRNQDKYEKYYPKYHHHKIMAAKYYHMIKENPVYSDFIDEESIFADSRYFTQESTHELND